MRSSKLSSLDPMEQTNPPTPLAMKSEKNKDKSRTAARHSKSQRRKLDFDSLKWRQQKILLFRGLRRLRKWDRIIQGDVGVHTNNLCFDKDKYTDDIAAIYFFAIGKALTEMLGDDSQFQEHVDRIKNLLESRVYQDDTTHAEVEPGPYQNLLDMINNLFYLLRPLERKSRQNSTSLDSPPTKMFKPLRGSRKPINHNDGYIGCVDSPLQERPLKRKSRQDSTSDSPPTTMFGLPGGSRKPINNEASYTSCVDSPLQERCISFSEEERIDSSPDHEKPILSAAGRRGPEAGGLNSERIATHSDEAQSIPISPNLKFALKIVDQLDAIREATEIPNPSNSQEVDSNDVSLHPLGNTGEKSLSQLGENTTEFGIAAPDNQWARMTRRLLDWARIEDTQDCLRSDAEVLDQQLNSELWQFLDELNSIIALIACLPDCQLFIMQDQNHYAKEVASTIYLSTLDEVTRSATDAIDEFCRQIVEGKSADHMKEDIHFFCVCIRRLSALVEDFGKTFLSFQLYFREAMTHFNPLDSLAHRDTVLEQDYISETEIEDSQDEDTLAEDTALDEDCVLRPDSRCEHICTEIRSRYALRRYRPLSLACYVSTDPNLLPSDFIALAHTLSPDELEVVTVGDLFESSDSGDSFESSGFEDDEEELL